MNKLQVTINSKAGAVQYDQLHTGPSGWADMTRSHLMAWAGAFTSSQTVKNARLILAALLYGIPQQLFVCVKGPDQDVIAGAVNFLFQKNELNNWLIPSIWHRFFKYHGPKHRLANITVNEFEKCEYCYEQFGLTKNPEYLDTLAAILYRPCRFWGVDDDIRVKLTAHGYIKRAKRFKKLSPVLKTAIYLNYEGCRNYLHKRFKDVFEKPANGKAAAGGAITPWPKIIESGSNDIFGAHQTTKTTLLHDFLSRLGTRIKEMKELEANH